MPKYTTAEHEPLTQHQGQAQQQQGDQTKHDPYGTHHEGAAIKGSGALQPPVRDHPTKDAPKDAPAVSAATVETNNNAYPYYNVAGSLKHQHHQLSGNPGDTLVVGLIFIYQVIFDPGVITGYTVTSIGNGQSQITFAASGAFTNVNVLIIGQ